MQLALQSGKIFIASKAIDFRAGIDGLCALVIEDMQQNPNSGLYIFYNKHLDKLKILGWHNNGFVMVYKRLESGKFFLRTNGEQIQLNAEQLKWLLTGVDWRLLSSVECKNNDYF
jgi:transposase